MEARKKIMCPSSKAQPGAQLLGVRQDDGTVAILPQPLRIDEAFVETANAVAPAEQRFRFTNKCVESGCMQWTGTRCGVADKVLSAILGLHQFFTLTGACHVGNSHTSQHFSVKFGLCGCFQHDKSPENRWLKAKRESLYRRASATHNPPPQAALPFLPPRLSFRRNLSTLRVHLVFIPRRVNRFFQNDKRGGRKRGVGKIPDLCTAHARQYHYFCLRLRSN
jgi:hypothetical protein